MDDAVAMLTEAAAQGHMEAQSRLANIYIFGYGVAQDTARGFELNTQAALQGHVDSQYNLGAAHLQGLGGEQSYERAAEWSAKAAEQGHAPAQLQLGSLYAAGRGVPQSYAEARRLLDLALEKFELASKKGNTAFGPSAVGRVAVTRQSLNDEIQRHCPLLGQRVVLRGLNTKALNGARGTAVDFGYSEREPGGFVSASGRYTVRLDGPEGRLVKVRVANVAEEDDWAGGAGGGGGGKKGKGVGKKGKGRK